MNLTVIFYLFLFLKNGPLAAQDPEVTTVVLVRHAEKQDDGTPDPSLSEIGKKRALRLKEIVSQLRPEQFFSTAYKRTRQTLEPAAGATPIQVYDPGSQTSFASRLASLKGPTVLVAGHSNTIPALVNLLLGSSVYPALEESQYDRVWILTIKDGKVLACHVLVY